MRFDIEVSKLDGRIGNPLAIFWPRPYASWYKFPKAGYRGERGRFMGGFNLGQLIVRAHVTWRPK